MRNKPLQDMTLNELWELFPIVLVPHNPKWIGWAKDEMELLSSILAEYKPIINHIGSTAVPNIQAKPIIDILVEVSTDVKWMQIKDIMETSGYICMSESDNRISFNKGYTPDGYDDKVFHIHFHRNGDNSEIIFRDYLISHSDAAKDYGQLKQSLLPKYRHDRNGYTEAKTEFINIVIRLAKRQMEFSMETDRLSFRRWRLDDAEALYKYASDGRVSKMALWPRHISVDMSRQVIRDFFQPNPFTMAMVLKESNEPIGCIGLVPVGEEHFNILPNEREVGYWIGYPYWSKGLTTEALSAMIDFYWEFLILDSLLITTDANNIASQRVAEKCGFNCIASYTYNGINSRTYRLNLKQSDGRLEMDLFTDPA